MRFAFGGGAVVLAGGMVLGTFALPAAGARSPRTSTSTSITTNWEKFFNGGTPASEKTKLLQNGTAFTSVIDGQARSSLAKSTTAKVLSVTQTSRTSATVRYDIDLAGKAALSNQAGTSLEQSGTWKVGDASFCALLALEGTKLAACATKAAPSLIIDAAARGKLGTILVTSSGYALYRYAKDTKGHSNCTGSCATIWPPLVLPTGAKGPTAGKGVAGLGTIRRANGALQVTYEGFALYRYASDTKSGQVNGNGIGGFSVVKLTGANATTTTTRSGYSY